MKELQATVYGKVQGVNFRKYTKKRADKLGVSGWVQNTDDGAVECVAQGKPEALDKLLSFLKTGPHFAEVNDIDFEITEQVAAPLFGFEIVR